MKIILFKPGDTEPELIEFTDAYVTEFVKTPYPTNSVLYSREKKQWFIFRIRPDYDNAQAIWQIAKDSDITADQKAWLLLLL